MKNKRAIKYELYQFPFDIMSEKRSKWKKRHLDVKGAIHSALKSVASDSDSLDGLLCAAFAEVYFNLEGKKALFLTESNILFFSRGRYQVNIFNHTILPHNIFTLNFPKGTQLGDFSVRGACAWFQEEHKPYDEAQKAFQSKFDLDGTGDESVFDKELIISLLVQDKGAYYHSMPISKALILLAVNKDTPKAFVKHCCQRLRDSEGGISGDGLFEKALCTAFYHAARLIMGISAFCQYRTDALQPGFPKVKFSLPQQSERPAASHLLTPSDASGSGASRDEHYRSWFLRQLCHEKYYQGEHANLKRGSRWVFVSDTLVNSNKLPENITTP
jgi:hypothetical protein